ncbi:MAG: hypothetical protein ACRBBO_16915 [Cognatishimia sp.]
MKENETSIADIFKLLNVDDLRQKLSQHEQEKNTRTGWYKALVVTNVVMIVLPVLVVYQYSDNWAWVVASLVLFISLGFLSLIFKNTLFGAYDDLFEEYKEFIERRSRMARAEEVIHIKVNTAGKFAEHLGKEFGTGKEIYIPTIEGLDRVISQAQNAVVALNKKNLDLQSRNDQREAEVHELREKAEQQITEKDELVKKVSQLQRKVSSQEKKLSIEKIKAEATESIVELTKAGADHQIHQAYHNSLDEIPLERVLRFLTDKLSHDDEVEVSHEDIAAMYGVMHEKFPDNDRVKELALIPHELLRARQIELIVERYSEKITEVEKSDHSEREKRDKINAYRLARERELGIEE